MAEYQIQMAEIASDGTEIDVHPKNRGFDTKVSSSFFGNDASKYNGTADDALRFLYKKFDNYVGKTEGVSKATSCVYSTSCNFANKSSSSTNSKQSTYAYTADKATYDSLGRNIVNTYISTGLLTTIYTSSSSTQYPFSITGLTNMKNVLNSKFNNYLLKSGTANTAKRTQETNTAKCDEDGNVISTTYLPKTAKATEASVADFSPKSEYNSGNATYATTGRHDSNNNSSCTVLRYVGIVNIAKFAKNKIYESSDLSKENLLIFDQVFNEVYIIFNGKTVRSLRTPKTSSAISNFILSGNIVYFNNYVTPGYTGSFILFRFS